MTLELEKLLPAYNFRIDDSGDLNRVINEIFQPVLDLACAEAERWVEQQDLDTMDSQTINALLRDLGNPFEAVFGETLNRRKLLARVLIDIYKSKGSEPALVDVIRAITGIDVVSIISPATIDSWDLGQDVIGDTAADPPLADPLNTDFAILGPDPQFTLYSFQVEVDRVLTDEEREILTEIINLVKPAHTHFLGFKEPTVAGLVDHWELNLSFLHESGETLVGDEVDLHE